MKLGFQKDELDSSSGQSLNGSFRKPRSGSTTSSTSKRIHRGLKTYIEQLVDLNLFTEALEHWVADNSFRDLYTIDELRNLDFALEVFPFQQLFRMPISSYKQDEYLALEDFLHTIADGLWRSFWHKTKELPFFVSCPRYPGSKFYTIEKAIARGRLDSLSGAALILKSSTKRHVRWGDVVQFTLFKPGIENGFSSDVICEALFYGVHMLLSRSESVTSHNSVFVLVVDSRYGGVVKLKGDVTKLEIDSSDPFHSIVEWIKCEAEVRVSPVHQIWNKLGNANWGDVGPLQLLLATFESFVERNGPPRKSISSLAIGHTIRLQQRRSTIVSVPVSIPFQHETQDREIVELYNRDYEGFTNQESRLKLQRGEILLLEDVDQGEKCFQIQDDSCVKEYDCTYLAVSLECPNELLTLYIGAHPSRLEPSWEDMNLWYQVRRQTKILNILKENGISCKYLPEIVASGRILHSGTCEKQTLKGCCDHPWCGTPVLVTYPVGESLSSIISRKPFSSEEAIRCCRDCLAALRTAKMANVQHGDICPENVIRIVDDQNPGGNCSYVLVSWGRAVLEDRDSPAMNLQFSSVHALQHGKLCPSSDAESLVYLIYFICGGSMQVQDSIESALQWKQSCWAEREIQQHVGEVSALLKAFADYVDNLCGTMYPFDYDVWLKRLSRAVDGSSEKGKRAEGRRIKDIGESSGTSGGGY